MVPVHACCRIALTRGDLQIGWKSECWPAFHSLVGQTQAPACAGKASIDENDPLLSEFQFAQQTVRVKAEWIFDNCPRYVHHMELQSYSPYAPAPGHTPPVPDWKRNPLFCDALPNSDVQALKETD
jgi:hypothetical protein